MRLKLLLIAQDILATGKLDGLRMDMLRQQLYADGNIDRATVDFLVGMYKRIQHHTPVFKHLFYQALKDHLLAREWIGAEESHWLEDVLFADDTFKDEEWKFLHEIKSEAKRISPEFEVFYKQSMKLAQDQRTYA